MKEDLEKKSIESLGEFGLINHLTAAFNASNSSTIFGVGDDCAVIERDESTYTLVSSDLFLENIHFDLMYVPLKHLGYKAISASISDVYAMNGMAEQVVVNIGLSSRFPIEAI
jgi:thiamine-monophosphate kinase